MSVQDIVQGMSKRIPWNVASLVLYSLGLPRGRGWDKTLEAYSSPNKKALRAEAELSSALTEHIVVGEKLVRIYDLTDEAIRSLRGSLASTKVENDSGNLAAFILNVELDAVALDPKLVDVVSIPGGQAVIYSSVRTMPERELLSDEMSDEMVGGRDDVEGVFAVISVPYRAFDVIIVPASGNRVELLMDFPLNAPQESILAAIHGVELAFGDTVGENVLDTPSNLFPLIDGMYHDANEGIVVELHFNTTAGSTHSARTRRRSANLRSDPYHNAGVKGLTAPIEPFSVTIRWQLPVDDKRNALPELTLHSSATERNKASPYLGTFVVRRCSDAEDFDYVRSRIYHHLDKLAV